MPDAPSHRCRISVGIATRDRPAGLERCLDALLGGRLPPAEVAVVDQGTGERVREIVATRESHGVRLAYVPQPPRGLSASRNAAIAHTRGQVIAFTDDDCVPDESWLERIAEAFDSADAPDALTGRVLALGPPTPGTHAVSLRTASLRSDYSRRTVPWHVGTGANIAVGREWIIRVNGFDERLGAGSAGRAAEDADLIYRLLCAGAHVRYEPGAIVYHERLSDTRRLATRAGYGHGIGALCAIHLRRGDLYALRMMGSWTRTVFRHLSRAAASRDHFELRQRWLSARGTLAGFLYGLRAGSRPDPLLTAARPTVSAPR